MTLAQASRSIHGHTAKIIRHGGEQVLVKRNSPATVPDTTDVEGKRFDLHGFYRM